MTGFLRRIACGAKSVASFLALCLALPLFALAAALDPELEA
jgi:hypothetical protein